MYDLQAVKYTLEFIVRKIRIFACMVLSASPISETEYWYIGMKK